MATKTDPFLAMLENSMPLSDTLVRKVATKPQKARAVDSGIPTFLKRDNNNKLPVADVVENKTQSRPDYADDIDAMVATLVRNGDVRFDVASDQYVAPYYLHRRIGVATGKIKKGAW